MKKTNIFLVVLFATFFICCKNNPEDSVIQTKEINQIKKDSVIYVGNKRTRYGFKKDTFSIKLPELNYIDGKATYVYDAIYDDMFKHPIYEDDYKEIYSITNIKIEDFGNTGIGFYLEDEPHIKYGFPLNEKIYEDDYLNNKEIYDNENEKPKVKVYVSVYKRDNHSDLKTILIDSIKLR